MSIYSKDHLQKSTFYVLFSPFNVFVFLLHEHVVKLECTKITNGMVYLWLESIPFKWLKHLRVIVSP